MRGLKSTEAMSRFMATHLQVAGCRLQVAGGRLQVAGCRRVAMGRDIASVGRGAYDRVPWSLRREAVAMVRCVAAAHMS